MRTSILGIHQYWNTDAVVANTVNICKTTHYDPRCQASCVAVVTAISLMLKRGERHVKSKGTYKVKEIIEDSYEMASKCLETEEEKQELRKYMTCENLSDLMLDESGKIGYTYKCLGSGFWALKQKDFRKAMQCLVMEAGDADTNCAVAGALLGCKLGLAALPKTWVSKLKHRAWLDEKINRFLSLQTEMREKSLKTDQCVK
ncbi:uncharacterized protein LOC121369272 [Gigantopelta aegis]|uniref:uncharacterized protein LOC121369272 n=1 Tax=Gigantopelta aegis TaxID=1735272 RepID=UPI001B88B2E3|nr:uncharacterized protein LOC121369272 [Gigantopelta aegis]